MELQEHGFSLSFEGFTNGQTLPKCQIPLEGFHQMTVRVTSKCDLKAANFQAGAKSCSATFPSPHILHTSKAVLNHPDIIINSSNWAKHEDKRKAFLEIQQFRELQTEKCSKEIEKVIQAGKLKDDELQKKIQNLEEKYLHSDINKEAARLMKNSLVLFCFCMYTSSNAWACWSVRCVLRNST